MLQTLFVRLGRFGVTLFVLLALAGLFALSILTSDKGLVRDSKVSATSSSNVNFDNVAPQRSSFSKTDSKSGLFVIALSSLPSEGQYIYSLILKGGPFEYEKDGSVFGNRERILPKAERGYYREYTVKTPNVKNRGARRIVCGGDVATSPDACYYTQDHYSSFKVISPSN